MKDPTKGMEIVQTCGIKKVRSIF